MREQYSRYKRSRNVETGSRFHVSPFLTVFYFLLKHIPQPSENPLYIRVSRQVHVCQTCTYHVPNIYLNMYLQLVFAKCLIYITKVHDGYMLGICSNNIYPISNPYVQRLFRRSRYMLTINDTKRPLVWHERAFYMTVKSMATCSPRPFFTRPSNTCYMAFQKVLEGLPAKNL